MSYHGTFKPPLSTSVPVGDNPPKVSILSQHKDNVEAILDDRLIMSATSITQYFIVKWHDCPAFDTTWITLEELCEFTPDLLD